MPSLNAHLPLADLDQVGRFPLVPVVPAPWSTLDRAKIDGSWQKSKTMLRRLLSIGSLPACTGPVELGGPKKQKLLPLVKSTCTAQVAATDPDLPVECAIIFHRNWDKIPVFS